MSTSRESWNDAAGYEPYIGRWSRLVARDHLEWLGVAAGRRWLDVGSGTGALSEAILTTCAPESLVGIDASAGYVEHLRATLGRDARARFVQADAQALPLGAGEVDHAVSGLVMNFVASPARAVAEMARVVTPGGWIAAYVWDYAAGMELIRRFWDAAIALDGAAHELDEGRRFPLCRPDALERLWRAAGMGAVEVRAIDVPTVFRDFDDYWQPFLGGQGPAPTYVSSLDAERRAALRERLRSALEARADGTIAMVARAWAVRGLAAP
ncbi:MAG TPA: class I SAM-dependent methyltransferase [Kofleriaceae bacterium]|nr:class I SAM-dependent methyltransferase [Kofleriaceae bacterium]